MSSKRKAIKKAITGYIILMILVVIASFFAGLAAGAYHPGFWILVIALVVLNYNYGMHLRKRIAELDREPDDP